MSLLRDAKGVVFRMNLMIQKPKLTKLFWITLAFIYLFVVTVIFALLTLPESTFDTENPTHVMAAVKLSYVRFTLACISMVIYPIILFSSLKYAKYLTVSLTAWAIAMYIDDHLVLYRVIEYPSRGVAVFLLSSRPILLACLMWMSFELTFTNPKAR